MVKNFVVNTNFLNIGKSIADKYMSWLHLENSGMMDYQTHPLLKSERIIKRDKDQSVISLKENGILFKIGKNTIIKTRDGSKGYLKKIIVNDEEKILFEVVKMRNFLFNNELLGYKFSCDETDRMLIEIKDVLPEVGHVYEFEGDTYIFFNKF